jgi:hypothetical protein
MKTKLPPSAVAVLPSDLEAAIATSIKPAKLPAKKVDAMKSRLLDRVACDSRGHRESRTGAHDALFSTLKAGEGVWRPLAPKAEMQILFDDGFTASWFARVHAGGRLPSHNHHHGHEECVVVSGSCFIDGVLMQVGDYQLARQGSRHVDIWSETGCVLFVRSPSFKAHAASL